MQTRLSTAWLIALLGCLAETTYLIDRLSSPDPYFLGSQNLLKPNITPCSAHFLVLQFTQLCLICSMANHLQGYVLMANFHR
jgi:hypothetical protein